MSVAILACASGAAPAQAPASLPLAGDLAAAAREARARGVPLLLAFTETGCPHCARARAEYWLPLQASAVYGRRVVIREVDVARSETIRDFGGNPVMPKEFAGRYRVTVVPAVIVVDHSGVPLAEPVVGLSGEDFYQLYLERAIDTAQAKLAK